MLEEEIDSFTDAESLRLLQEVGSSDQAPAILRVVSETPSTRLTFVTSSSRSYYTARTKQSHPSMRNPQTFSKPSAGSRFALHQNHKSSIHNNQSYQQPEIVQPQGQSSVDTQAAVLTRQSVGSDSADIPHQQRWIAALVSRVTQHEESPVFSVRDLEYGNVLKPVQQDDDALCTPRLAELSLLANNGSSLAQRMFIE
jgi:hypothetical protein